MGDMFTTKNHNYSDVIEIKKSIRNICSANTDIVIKDILFAMKIFQYDKVISQIAFEKDNY